MIASTFEAFVDELEPYQDQLPEVTSEIGDTWIQGVGSDPEKVAQYKAIMRMRRYAHAADLPSPCLRLVP